MAYELLMSKIKVGKHQLLRNQIVNLVFLSPLLYLFQSLLVQKPMKSVPFDVFFQRELRLGN